MTVHIDQENLSIVYFQQRSGYWRYLGDTLSLPEKILKLILQTDGKAAAFFLLL